MLTLIPSKGEELWVSDGTEPGPKLLKDIYPTGQSFLPSSASSYFAG
ncbi:MAG: hypothetical protein IPO07_20775 [Haliscomenobacter sp.]|nr:hypothetical protein [Haliscomenobacter sp.]